VLAGVALQSWLVVQAKKLLPGVCALRGDAEIGRTIADCTERARGRGFGDDELLSFVTLELLFGPRFDDEARNPWAQPALSGSGSAADRMQELREAAVFHLAERGEA